MTKKHSIIHVKAQTGVPIYLSSSVAGVDPIVSSYPGTYKLEGYDPGYLLINEVEWVPKSKLNPHPSLVLKVTPLKKGKTKVTTLVQYDQYHPLFIFYQFDITIEDKTKRSFWKKMLDSWKFLQRLVCLEISLDP